MALKPFEEWWHFTRRYSFAQGLERRSSAYLFITTTTIVCTFILALVACHLADHTSPTPLTMHVPSFLEAKRYTVPRGENSAVSDAHDWQNRIPNKRLLVVQFISQERVDEFVRSWPSHESGLLHNTKNVSVLLTCPHSDFEHVKNGIINQLNWRFIERINHLHPFTASLPLYRYSLPTSSAEVYLQPLILDLPRYYLQQAPVPPTCSNRTWSLTYALYSGAVFSYHIIHLPMLSKFDYILKLDTDIHFLTGMPFDIGEKMEVNKCLVAHTKIDPSTDCENKVLQAVIHAAHALDLPPPKSQGYNWCNENSRDLKPSSIFYGNFLAFSTHHLLLHPHIQAISTYLYEEWQDGYFTYRWGDQAPFAMYACYMLDVPNLYNDEKICDFEYLRGEIFKHKD